MKVDSAAHAAIVNPETKVFHGRIFGCRKPTSGGTLNRDMIGGLLFTDEGEGMFPDGKWNMTDCTVIIIPKGEMKEAVNQGASIEDLLMVLGEADKWRVK